MLFKQRKYRSAENGFAGGGGKDIAALKLTDIVKVYGQGENAVTALKGINISFRKNEFVSILGPSGCGKTRLLKQLKASEVHSVEKYSVEAIKELIMEKIYSSPHRRRNLAGDDIIAIEDIDFLSAAKSLQIEAAILIEKASAEHAVIITGIQLSKRVPVMMKTLERHCDNLLVWKYQS